ncbi:MAG: TIGR03905 family TSCPD domain-containing protein [Erysipelotrichia bacterium]|nr:TIGR03905 family TSCPD domain-containing protein [Erysipelotrichia bacterium]NCC53900.1 TIGR03905 family TSCPD domain-containing protein [Erysipelotrichia bacterium]
MEKYSYKPKGTCSRMMDFTIEDNKIIDAKITGGCDGNLKGICKIMQNKTLDEVIDAFQGITCGFKKTSCPDQIACALLQYQKQQ